MSVDPEERETVIVYDHSDKKVKVFTTEPAVFRNFQKRLGKKNPDVLMNDKGNGTYEVECAEKVLRKPHYISPVIK